MLTFVKASGEGSLGEGTDVMHGYSYEEPEGGFLRLPGAALLTALLGGGAFFGGRTGGQVACDGACAVVQPVANVLQGSLPMMGDTASWGLAGAIGAGGALLFALLSEPRRYVTAGVSLLALAIFGLMLLGGRAGELASDALGTVAEATDTLPAPPAAPAAPALSCPPGQFARGEACATCFTEEDVPTAQALTLTPLRLAATWGYARDDSFAAYDSMTFDTGGTPLPLRNFALGDRLAVAGGDLCGADAALILGSASSDGPRARNVARARRRAEQLSREVRAACPRLTIFAASLGQSTAPTDRPADRALTVIAVEGATGTVTRAAVEAELGYRLAEGGPAGLPGAPLLGRLRHFGGEWTWVEGGEGRFDPAPRPRPSERVSRRRADAPASCERPVV